MPITLFKLPYLVWILVIKTMDLLELVSMSKTSARTRRVTIGYTKSQPIIIEVNRALTNVESVKFGANEQKIFMWPQNWDSEAAIATRVRNKITWLVDTFNVASISFGFVLVDIEHCCQLLEYARSLRFDHIYYYGPFESAELTRRFVNLCGNAASLQLRIQYNTTRFGRDEVEWTNNFIALMDCPNVSISRCFFDTDLLNRVIINWMHGTWRVQKFEIIWKHMGGSSLMLDGFERIVIVPNEIWQVQRQDGTRARIHVRSFRFTFNVMSD